jgi:RNA polymerase sigma factor (sigma-70 family)
MPKDQKAEFYEEHISDTRKAMLDYARLHVGDAGQAEDIVQDTCYTAWVKIDALMSSPNPGGWLMNALKNHIRKYYDKLKAEAKLAEALEINAVLKAAYFDSPEKSSDDSPVEKMLSDDDLRIARLREQGFTDDEIAKALGMKPGAVRARFFRMRGKLTEYSEERKNENEK